MNSFFLAYVDTISQYSPSHINISISLKECFCLTFRCYLLLFIVILEYSESLVRLGTNFICI